MTIGAGILMAAQSRIVGSFGAFTDNGPQYLFINGVFVIAVLSAFAAANAPLRRAVLSIPLLLRTRQLRWYACLGGAAGAWFPISAILTVPRLGLAIFVVCSVCGVFVMSIVLDALGVGPGGRKPPTIYRTIGAALALVAVLVDVAPAAAQHGMGSATPVNGLLALSGGFAVAVQQALNGRASAATGNSIAAAWLNYVTITVTLAIEVGVAAATGVRPLETVTDAPLWFLVPGIIGMTWVGMSAWAVGAIGVLRLSLLSVFGQILAAFVLDLLAPMVDAAMEVRTAAACALALCAAFVTTRVKRPPALRGT